MIHRLLLTEIVPFKYFEMQRNQPVFPMWEVVSTDLCVQMRGAKAKNCPKKKYSSKAQIPDTSTSVQLQSICTWCYFQPLLIWLAEPVTRSARESICRLRPRSRSLSGNLLCRFAFDSDTCNAVRDSSPGPVHLWQTKPAEPPPTASAQHSVSETPLACRTLPPARSNL